MMPEFFFPSEPLETETACSLLSGKNEENRIYDLSDEEEMEIIRDAKFNPVIRLNKLSDDDINMLCK